MDGGLVVSALRCGVYFVLIGLAAELICCCSSYVLWLGGSLPCPTRLAAGGLCTVSTVLLTLSISLLFWVTVLLSF